MNIFKKTALATGDFLLKYDDTVIGICIYTIVFVVAILIIACIELL